MIYLIDGDNLLHFMGFNSFSSIDAGRRRLLDWIADSFPQQIIDPGIITIFDAANTKRKLPDRHHRGIAVQFSFQETADDVIETIIASAMKNQFAVISNDNRLKEFALRKLQIHYSCEELLDLSLQDPKNETTEEDKNNKIEENKPSVDAMSPEELEEWEEIFNKPRKPR